MNELDQLRDMWTTATPEEQHRITALAALIKAEQLPLHTWARHYAAAGIPIFPCTPGKAPLTSNGFHDATTDPDQIDTWWRRNPNANIGTPTGHRFVVIDIDPGGYEPAATTPIDDNGRTVRTWHQEEGIARVGTPRNGTHLYFHATVNLRTATNILPNVDSRGEGGYVLLPPSVGANGHPYRWSHGWHNIGLELPA